MADLTARTRGAVAALSRSARSGFVREAGLVAAAMVAYFGIRNRTVGGPEEAFVNAYRIIDFERWLHIEWEDSVQAWIVGSDFLVMLTNWVYIWGHWPVILGTAILLYRYRRDRYYLLRNALFVSGVIGFFFFAVMFVAPPRLLDLGLVDTVTDQSSSYRALQPAGLTNQYAAFPSLHVGLEHRRRHRVADDDRAPSSFACWPSRRHSRWASQSSQPRIISSSTSSPACSSCSSG